MDWFYITIISMLLFGLQGFLFNISAKRKCNSAWVFFFFTLTVTMISSTLYFLDDDRTLAGNIMLFLIIALGNAAVFIISTVSRIEAMKYLDSTIVYPIIRMSTIFTVIYSIIFFKESLNIFNIFGIFVGAISIFILTIDKNKKAKTIDVKKGFVLTFIALVSSSLSFISSKYAAVLDFNLLGFIAVSYGINIFLSLLVRNKFQDNSKIDNMGETVVLGIIIGIVNFISFYLMLDTLKTGPLSLISVITSMGFVVTIGLSMIFFNEKLDRYKIAGIVLSVLAIALMRVV